MKGEEKSQGTVVHIAILFIGSLNISSDEKKHKATAGRRVFCWIHQP